MTTQLSSFSVLFDVSFLMVADSLRSISETQSHGTFSIYEDSHASWIHVHYLPDQLNVLEGLDHG